MSQAFASGRYAIGLCDRCGWKYRLYELKNLVINEKVTGLKVCPQCIEKDHPQLRIGKHPIFDPQALRNPSPDNTVEASRNIAWGWNPLVGVTMSVSVGTVRIA